MIRDISKEKFLDVIERRPASIRNMRNASEDFLADCIVKNTDVLTYLEDKSKFTQSLLEAVLSKFTKEKYWNLDRKVQDIVSAFPVEMKGLIPVKIIEKLCAAKIDVVKQFPNAPYKIYLEYATTDTYLSYGDFPEQYLTEDILIELFSKGARDFRDEKLTGAIIDGAIVKNPRVLYETPAKFLTPNRLKKALTLEQINIGGLKIGIPEEFWDEELAALCVGNNIMSVPDKWITKDLCLKSVAQNSNLLHELPERFRMDRDVILEAIAQSKSYLDSNNKDFLETLPVSIFDAEGIQRIAEINKVSSECSGIKCLIGFLPMTEAVWIQILTTCPWAIRYLEKPQQTAAIMDSYIQTTPVEILDEVVKYINLARVRKEQAPFLIGSKSEILQKLASTKLKGRGDIQVTLKEPVKASSSVQIDLTDGEYLEIVKKFNL